MRPTNDVAAVDPPGWGPNVGERGPNQGGRGREKRAERPERAADGTPNDGKRGPRGGTDSRKSKPPTKGSGAGPRKTGGKPPRPGDKVPPGTKSPYKSVRGPAGRGREIRREVVPAMPVAPGNELLYGRNAVLEALRSPRDLRRLWLAEGVREDERMRAVLGEAERRGIALERVPRMMLDDALAGANHQGVALEGGPYRYADLDAVLARPGTLLVLDHLQDPQNFGTLLRAAEAAGVAGVAIPADRAVEVTPAVVNASAGAVEHLRIARVANLAQALEAAKASGRWVLGLAGDAGAVDLFAGDLPTPAALVVGAEGGGLGQRVRSLCDVLVALPMRGTVASLNAATAGSIALYELLRREGTGTPRS